MQLAVTQDTTPHHVPRAFCWPSHLPRYMQMWQAALCGMILKLDHSFKVVKRVRDATAHKEFAAVLTVMNEFCQVRLWLDRALWELSADSQPTNTTCLLAGWP